MNRISDATAKIINWDLSHLTQQQIEHLHALKNQAQKDYIRDYMKTLKSDCEEPASL